ncbi:MAG: AEC family transporter [Simkaniaceae bacterium]|nr:AEC family transporter [Simkaniaceae bacterium]
MDILHIILPVFAIIVTGWLLRAINYITDSMAEQMYVFARRVAAPALLLFSLGSVSFGQIWYWDYVGVFGVVTFGVFIVVAYLATVMMKKSFNRVACGAFACMVGNAAFFGLPFLYGIFGRRAMVPAAVTMLILLVMYAVVVFILEMAGSKRSFENAIRKAGTVLFTEIVVIAAIIGILYSLTGLPIPDGVAKYLRFFEVSFVAVALFAFGAQINFKNFAKECSEEFFPMVWKVAVMPALMLWVSWAFKIQAMWAVVGILVSAMPTAFIAQVLTKAYGKDKQKSVVERVGRISRVTAVCGLVALFFWLLILAHLYPSEFRFTRSFY